MENQVKDGFNRGFSKGLELGNTKAIRNMEDNAIGALTREKKNENYGKMFYYLGYINGLQTAGQYVGYPDSMKK
jgi:hypothetical protein